MEAILAFVGIIVAMAVFQLIIQGIFVALGGLWRAILPGNNTAPRESGSGCAEYSGAAREPFSIRVGREEYEDLDCLVPEIRGVLSFSTALAPHYVKLQIRDLTGDGPSSVLCEISSLQHDDSREFLFRTNSRESPPPNHFAHISGWKLCRIPIAALDFPRSGKRSIAFRAEVLYESDKLGSIAEAEASMYLPVRQPGYMEKIEMQQRGEEISVALAVAVGIADGVLHVRERDIIRGWIRKRVAIYDGDNEERDRLLGQYHQSLEHPDDAEDIARELCNAPDSIKIMALELCFKVAGADERTDAAEQEILNIIIEAMEMEDIKRINSLRDRHLPPPEEHGDMAEFLGIRADMPDEEKQKILRHEFAKWNGITASVDPEKRKKAEFMLRLIAETRNKIKTGNRHTQN